MKKEILVFLFAVCSVLALQTAKPCRLQQAEYGYVCICDSDYCDSLYVPEPKCGNKFTLITSSEDGDRFTYINGRFKKRGYSKSDSLQLCVNINRRKRHQKIIGFGGAMTGAVSYILDRLPSSLRKCVYKSYYSKRFGMGYSMMRIPLGGCDFDLEPWAYNEYPPNDTKLSNFTKLDPRDKHRNDQIRDLMRVSCIPNVKILSAAWSSPKWMKTRYDWVGYNSNTIQPKYYQTWANYHLKYIQLMRKDNMPIWGVSTGNEPLIATENYLWESLYWDPKQQAIWIDENFGPTMKKAHVAVHAFDLFRTNVTDWFKNITKEKPRVMDQVSFIDIHAYYDSITSPLILDKLHQKYGKPIVYSEMSFGAVDAKKILRGSWSRAVELIGIQMQNLHHYMSAYIDWNMVLNSTGGPNYVGEFTDAYILTNENFTGIIKQPLFYAMAHFSKFIPPNSIRVEAKFSGDPNPLFQAVAFVRPDKRITVILHNNNTFEAINVTIFDSHKGEIKLKLKPRSLNTLVYSIRKCRDKN